MGKRIIVTGGSGKAGKYVVQSLLDKGYEVLNLDLAPIHGDLGESQVYSALMSHFRLTEPFHESLNEAPSAVIHLAGVARNMLVPDSELFRINTMGTYNIIEAACRFGVKKIMLASSICVYGVTFAEGDADFVSFPVEESTETRPTDVYSLSKLCAERTAQSFASRFNIDIYAFRIGAIIAPEEYERVFDSYVKQPARWKVHGWSYTDARDLGRMCALGIQGDGLGFQVFNAVNNEITNTRDTGEFLRDQCPGTPFTRDIGAREAPISNHKMRLLLGFEEEHKWRRYYQV
ncbi:hypothetical protein KVR01_013024 [Diaporthe batatas]|uniref:uncharacterized protein n=1 Tax=Diaporthe batatas TaxID=748121 RepID=UPI001D055E91|nr:uncharacterized protein KVR01_013024 [Diaporthe batatas]KAG8157034.1 hypothetical protein KVR01_013024 [Diaporthe batatas]